MTNTARHANISKVRNIVVRPLAALLVLAISMLFLLNNPSGAQEPGSENIVIQNSKNVVISPPHTRGRYVVQRRPPYVDVRASGWHCAVFGDQVDTSFNLSERVASAIRRLTNPNTVLIQIPDDIRSLTRYAFLQSVLNLARVSGTPVRYANNIKVHIDLSSRTREAQFLDCFLRSELDRLKAAYLEAFDTAVSLRQ